MRKRRLGPQPILLSKIQHNSTCISLNLPLHLACRICSPKLDIHTRRGRKQKSKERHKCDRRKCLQHWSSRWITSQNSTPGQAKLYKLTRSYLNIDPETTIDYFCAYGKREQVESSPIKKIKPLKQTNNVGTLLNASNKAATLSKFMNEESEWPTDPPSGFKEIPTHHSFLLDALKSLQKNEFALSDEILQSLENLNEADANIIKKSPNIYNLIRSCLQECALNKETEPIVPTDVPLATHDVKLENGNIVKGIPIMYDIVSKKEKKKIVLGQKLHNKIKSKKFNFTNPISKNVLSVGMAHVPGLSFLGAEVLIPCIIASFLLEVGCEFNPLDITSFTPSQNTVKALIENTAMNAFINFRNLLHEEDIHIFLSSDHGNKKGLHHLVKVISMWDFEKDEVRRIILDMDATGGSSEETAAGIDASLTKLDKLNKRTLLDGQHGDAGGGGTGISLQNICFRSGKGYVRSKNI